MDTQKRARKAWTALGFLVLGAGLIAFPVSASTNLSVPVSCCPKPPSADEQVVDGAEALVSTAGSSAQSQSPDPIPSPLPTPGLTDVASSLDLEVPGGNTDGGTGASGTGGGENIEVRPTTTPSPSVQTSAPKSSSLAKCATCTPNLKAKASGLANVVEAGSGAAAAAAGEAAEAGSADRDYKDLTQGDGEATPPAAVPGFGPVFALAGLALLVWVRRRASG